MSYSSTYAVPASNLLEKPVLINLDKTSATEVQTLGDTVRSKDGKRFQHVYYDSSGVVVVAGSPAVWVDTTTDFVVTSDVSDAGGAALPISGAGAAGVFCAPIAADDNSYVWIQTGGFCAGLRCGTGITANQPLQMSTTDLFENIGSTLSGWTAAFQAIALGANTDATGGGNSTCDAMLFCD